MIYCRMAIFQLENDMANKTQNLQYQLDQSQVQLRDALKRCEWCEDNSTAVPPALQENREQNFDIQRSGDDADEHPTASRGAP